MKKLSLFIVIAFALVIMSAGTAYADRIYTEGLLQYTFNDDGDVIITGYYGSGDDAGVCTVPAQIGGRRLASVRKGAFAGSGAALIRIPDGVTVDEGALSSGQSCEFYDLVEKSLPEQPQEQEGGMLPDGTDDAFGEGTGGTDPRIIISGDGTFPGINDMYVNSRTGSGTETQNAGEEDAQGDTLREDSFLRGSFSGGSYSGSTSGRRYPEDSGGMSGQVYPADAGGVSGQVYPADAAGVSAGKASARYGISVAVSSGGFEECDIASGGDDWEAEEENPVLTGPVRRITAQDNGENAASGTDASVQPAAAGRAQTTETEETAGGLMAFVRSVIQTVIDFIFMLMKAVWTLCQRGRF